MLNRLKKIWRGREKLPYLFWYWGVLGSMTGVVLAIVIEESYVWPISRWIVFVLFFLAYSVFVGVGIWRSATARSRKHQVKRLFLGTAAKAVACANVVGWASAALVLMFFATTLQFASKV